MSGWSHNPNTWAKIRTLIWVEALVSIRVSQVVLLGLAYMVSLVSLPKCWSLKLLTSVQIGFSGPSGGVTKPWTYAFAEISPLLGLTDMSVEG